MPTRSHHSIGEVLSLLQDDFPDITISKIRFLESQGLISPERTPSGYRRFFERDLERLRWILTQQRDHYLPLKVIREKLASGEPLPDVASAPSGGEEATSEGGTDTGTTELVGEPSVPAGEDVGGIPRGEGLNGHDLSGKQQGVASSDAPDATPAGSGPDLPAGDAEPGDGPPEMTPMDVSPVEAGPATADGDVMELLEAGELIGASGLGGPPEAGAALGAGNDDLVAEADPSSSSSGGSGEAVISGQEASGAPDAAGPVEGGNEAGDAEGPQIATSIDQLDPLLDAGPSVPDVVDPAPAPQSGSDQVPWDNADEPSSDLDSERAEPVTDDRPTARPRQRRSQGSRGGPDVSLAGGTESEPTEPEPAPGSASADLAAAPVEAALAPGTAGSGPIEVASGASDPTGAEDGTLSDESTSPIEAESGSGQAEVVLGSGTSQLGGAEAAPAPTEPPVSAAGKPETRPQTSQPPAIVTLTRDELAELSGCSLPVLNDLERFGLLHGKTVGRGVLYDNDAVVVARLAASFANHGLEPRHLRSFRLAAEREIGLFAQVVGPLLQRRDAMAHDRAMQTLTELADLASELHEVLVRDLVNREFGKG